MIDPIIFFGLLACLSLGGFALASAGGVALPGYSGKHLKGGYICEVCGKPLIGKETTHTREECKDYRSRPYQPDHACYFGADKYTRMPDYQSSTPSTIKEEG